MMTQDSKEFLFFSTLSETKKLYEKVKYAIILSENFDPEREFYVASSNQMRSALDHIFKAMDLDEENMMYEMKEVEEHLIRAGYDAYEILASNICLNISNKMSLYSPPIISRVFPQYYCDIKPIIIEKIPTLEIHRKYKKRETILYWALTIILAVATFLIGMYLK